MKKVIFRAGALLFAILTLSAFTAAVLLSAYRGAQVKAVGGSSARGMCVIDVATGRVLFSQNADTKMGMASTTKIVTALTILENTADIDTKIRINDSAVGIEGSSIYLQRGEMLTVRELLYGLMLRSGNDSAVALALSVSPTVAEFADLMNQTAKKYGAFNSNFTNPHGLDDENHYTTAYDLAKLSAEALKNPVFAEIAATEQKRIDGLDENGEPLPRILHNKNKLLKTLDGCIGVKTGFTKKCGRCFVGAREVDGQKIVCAVLNCGPMFEETAQLLRDAQSIYGNKQILTADEFFYDSSGACAIASASFAYPLSAAELPALFIQITDNIVTISLNGTVIHRSPCAPVPQ
jgi:D-alanyl-D-alanine carboxypeptidase (penicillin-binding protein 5/6)